MIVVLGGRYAGGAGEDPLQCAGTFAEKLDAQCVLVLTEMGCGIVPAEHGERQFREMNGRVNCLFAEQAEQVIRVIAGVGQRIK